MFTLFMGAEMGVLTAAAFSLGVAYGVASFHVSNARPSDAIQSFAIILHGQEQLLITRGYIKPTDYLSQTDVASHSNIEAKRWLVEDHIKTSTKDSANGIGDAYEMGVWTGVAEGHGTGPNWGQSIDFAHTAITNAGTPAGVVKGFAHTQLSQPCTLPDNRAFTCSLEQALYLTENVSRSDESSFHTFMQVLNARFWHILYDADTP